MQIAAEGSKAIQAELERVLGEVEQIDKDEGRCRGEDKEHRLTRQVSLSTWPPPWEGT